MATVTSKVADKGHAAVFLTVEDKNGVTSNHTIYVLGLNGKTVDARIAEILIEVDVAADAINAAFAQAGM